MKALSVRQPWASMIAGGRKTIEVRSWPTAYRGDLLICASARPILHRDGAALPVGVAVAVVAVVDCRRPAGGPDANSDFAAAGGFQPLPYHWCWILDRIRPLIRPVPVKGQLSIFTVDPAIAAAVLEQFSDRSLAADFFAAEP